MVRRLLNPVFEFLFDCAAVSFPKMFVNAPHVSFDPEFIHSTYTYQDTLVSNSPQGLILEPTQQIYHFQVQRRVPKVGLLMIGWGGNNGSTLTASILANRLQISWKTKEGVKSPNYFGSLTQASTLRLGSDRMGQDVHVPFSQILPMTHPNDWVLGGWDISAANLAQAMERAQVLDYDLQRQLVTEMEKMTPMPSIYYPDFIAANQSERADNLIHGSKQEQLDQIRKDIKQVSSQTHALETLRNFTSWNPLLLFGQPTRSVIVKYVQTLF